MFFFKRKPAETPRAASSLPPLDEVPHVHDAEKVLSLAQVLSQQSDFKEILRLIASKGLTLFNADSFTIDMVNPATQHTIKTLLREGVGCDDRQLHLLRVNVTGWVMKHGQPFLCADLSTDDRFTRGLFARIPACSAMCVPMQNERLVCGQGREPLLARCPAIALHDLHSAIGDYAIARAVKFAECDRMKRICTWLTYYQMLEDHPELAPRDSASATLASATDQR